MAENYDHILTELHTALAATMAELGRLHAVQERAMRLRNAIQSIEAITRIPANMDLGTRLSLSPPPITSEVPFRSLVQGVHDRLLTRLATMPKGPTDAAIIVLREAGRPMHIRDLITIIQEKGWYGNRDYESLRGTIASSLNAKSREGDTVIKLDGPVYALRADRSPDEDEEDAEHS